MGEDLLQLKPFLIWSATSSKVERHEEVMTSWDLLKEHLHAREMEKRKIILESKEVKVVKNKNKEDIFGQKDYQYVNVLHYPFCFYLIGI